MTPDRLRVPGVAFLLSQVGFHSSRRWNDRLEPLGIDPRQVTLLRHVAAEEGQSQQALGERLKIPASRMVALVDDLEHRGLLQRRPHPEDRRVRALHLTNDGERVLGRVMEVGAEHEAEICRGLGSDERERLIALLARVAAEQGLTEGVHPGVAEPHDRHP